MNEEVRTMKVYGKSTNNCYKVEVREEDLEKANSNSKWMEERFEEEASKETTEETEEGETTFYT
ncbi:hypothetical protein A2U01_0099816, partial [Trifolium medium]|nr:hypothetical protein [Trifolium medium]